MAAGDGEAEWLEAEIQRQLDSIALPDATDADAEDLSLADDSDIEELIEDSKIDVELEEAPSELQAYVSHLHQQSQRMHDTLDDCESLLIHQRNTAVVSIPTTDDVLEAEAKKHGMKLEEFTQKILEDINREEEEELLESHVRTADKIEDTNISPQNANANSSTERQTTFVTQNHMDGLDPLEKLEPESAEKKREVDLNEITKTTTVKENTESTSAKQNEANTAVKENAIVNENGENAIVNETAEDSTVACNSVDGKTQQADTENNTSLKPGEGIMVEFTPVDVLQHQLQDQLRQLDVKKRYMEEKAKQMYQKRAEVEDRCMQERDLHRQSKIQQMQQEEEELTILKQEREKELAAEAEVAENNLQQSVKQFEAKMSELSKRTLQEQEEMRLARELLEEQKRKKRDKAATNIQSAYRGYRVRKSHKEELQKRVNQKKEEILQQKIEQVEAKRQDERRKEQERKEEEERLIKENALKQEKEEEIKRERERIQKEAEQRKKDEEKKRKEEEKKKKEEEKKQKEEERKRQEEEKKQKEEEKRQKEEEKRKAEETRKRIEEERKRIEAEQQLLKEEEEKKKKEMEEAERKAEEERKRKMEEERLKEAERRKKEEECKRREEQRQREIKEREAKNKAIQDAKRREEEEKERIKASIQRLESEKKNEKTFEVSEIEDWGEFLPEHLEAMRLEWIKKCIPMSKVKSEKKGHTPASRPRRRPLSAAKKLPLLEESVILQAAKVAALQQVTTVELTELPGCDISPLLAKCPHLSSLSITHSQLVSIDLPASATNLKLVELQHNSIESLLVHCPAIVWLDVSHNKLSSLHGLDGAGASLRYLNLSHNSVTRLAGIEPLCHLQHLDISHNQLSSVRGISAVGATLQHLDIAHNFLPTVDAEIERCGLLRELRMDGNNIIKFPSLSNQVLLCELSALNNSICSVQALSQSWLPLLNTLNFHQNSISKVDSLTSCILLENVDLSNNQILDLSGISSMLQSSRCLSNINLEGNPLQADPHYSAGVRSRLPLLRVLDAKVMCTEPAQLCHRTQYENMCLAQLQQHQQLKQAYSEAIRSTTCLAQKATIHLQYFDQSHQLAVDHRYAHEYGISLIEPKPLQFLFSTNNSPTNNLPAKVPVTNSRNELKQTSQDSDHSKTNLNAGKNAFELALLQSSQTGTGSLRTRDVQQSPRNVDGRQTLAENLSKPTKQTSATQPGSRLNQLETRSNHRDSNSTLLDSKSVPPESTSLPSENRTAQQVPRPPTESRPALARPASGRSKFEAALNKAVTGVTAPAVIAHTQEAEAMNGSSPAVFNPRAVQEKNTAATKIQAYWRGYSLRKRLMYALNCADFDSDDDFSFGEVDMEAFNLVEAQLDVDWLPPESPQLPRSVHPILPAPPMVPPAVPPLELSSPQAPPEEPRTAWKAPLPPVTRHMDTQSTATTRTGALSKKGEKLSEEWGFVDARTAELMMARAKKLKYNADKKKKIKQLDPKQRLALFRKLEESSKLHPVHQSNRRVLPKKEYFKAKEEEVARVERDQAIEKESRVSRTFEWIHTQVGHHAIDSSRINNNQSNSQYSSDGNLPKMDPVVLAGGRACFTGSPVELQSVSSVSTMGDMTAPPRPRKLSIDSYHHNVNKEHLPAIKTSSAPSSGPEKMSWRRRNKPVQPENSWGQGRKRMK